MHKLIAGLAAAALLAAPAAAADLFDDRVNATQQGAAFAGARLRVPLGGERAEQKLRLGLVATPTLRTEGAGAPTNLRFGEGFELGIKGKQPLTLSLAGRPLTGPEAERLSGDRAGISKVGWVAIGVGVAALAVLVWYVDAGNKATD